MPHDPILPPAVPSNSPPNRPKLKFLFRALESRNYRLFISGQLISLIGTWLTNMASSWLVNRITDSSTMLGLVNFSSLIPAFLLCPFAGVMVDRWPKHRLLIWTQTLSMLESFALAALAFIAVGGPGITGIVTKPTPHTVHVVMIWLICLAAFQGLVNAFDVPARQSFVVQLVDKREDLPNAIALNSSMFNLARLLGPAVAGLLISWVGEGWCFTLDGMSYIAVIIALFMMRVKTAPPPKTNRHVLVEFAEGFRYAAHSPAIRPIILLLGIVSFSAAPQMVLLPRFATEVLHGNAVTQGWLAASSAAGALLGAILLAARKSVLGLGKQMPIACVGLAIGMTLLGLSNALIFSMAAMTIIGFCTMTQMAAGNTLLQTIVDDDMRGRVMSLFTMAFMGMMPMGALVAGILGQSTLLGPQKTCMAGACVVLIAAVVFATRLGAIRHHVRPIYVQRGILPQTAEGLEATEVIMEERER